MSGIKSSSKKSPDDMDIHDFSKEQYKKDSRDQQSLKSQLIDNALFYVDT